MCQGCAGQKIELVQRLSFKVVASMTSNDHRQNFVSDVGVCSRAVFGLPSLLRLPQWVEGMRCFSGKTIRFRLGRA